MWFSQNVGNCCSILKVRFKRFPAILRDRSDHMKSTSGPQNQHRALNEIIKGIGGFHGGHVGGIKQLKPFA